jgi:deazaflavin-dependent oxidoreductase (nitroreductase family)
MKHRIVHALQKYLLNPPVKLFLALGVAPPGYALLETVGRTTGMPRRTPVGNAIHGSTCWIVSEHGLKSGYVRNIARNPRVRVKVRRGLRQAWIPGTAHLLPEDDPRQRQRMLAHGHPLRGLNAMAVRTLGTELLTVRIDLDH